MSHTTETLHVRGARRTRVLDAITARMSALGFDRVEQHDSADAEPDLRRLALRRDGKWLTLADGGTEGGRGENEIDAWGEHLSRALGRSVLAIWTSDGEAAVRVTRWKKGTTRAELTLLEEAYRKNGLAYAPAKVLWPWLAAAKRDTVLREGIKLVTPSGGSTGDTVVDGLLEDFDEGDRLESVETDDGNVFVDEGVSVTAIGSAVGLANPFLNPWEPDDGDEQLLFVARGHS